VFSPSSIVTVDDLLSGLDEVRRTRAREIHVFAHAVSNALFVMRTNAAVIAKGDDAALRDLQQAAREIDRLLAELKCSADADAGLIRMPPRKLDVAAIAEAARSLGIEVSIAETAPVEIEIDPLAFDRVLRDFLRIASGTLTIGGRPGALVLSLPVQKVDPHEIFRAPNGSLARTLRPLASVGARVTFDHAKIEIRVPLTHEARAADGDVDRLLDCVVTKSEAE
jgi:hypothetical protein